jgi:hypothetical protein
MDIWSLMAFVAGLGLGATLGYFMRWLYENKS